jgi:hypothetical protein
MPISFYIDRERDVLYRTIEGPTTIEEVVQSVVEVLDHPGFHPGIKSLTDVRRLDRHMGAEEMKRLAKLISHYRDRIAGGRAAVVVPSEVSYGSLRVLKAYAGDSPLDIAIFYDLEEARSWLGIEKT